MAASYPVIVGIATQVVLPFNPGRRWALFVNDSANIIYLALGTFATVNQGVRLNALGGSYQIDALNSYTGDVSAVCAVAAMTLLVVEEAFGPR